MRRLIDGEREVSSGALALGLWAGEMAHERRAPTSSQRRCRVFVPTRNERQKYPSDAKYAEHYPESRCDATLREVTESHGQVHRTRDRERRIRHAEESRAGLKGVLARRY